MICARESLHSRNRHMQAVGTHGNGHMQATDTHTWAKHMHTWGSSACNDAPLSSPRHMPCRGLPQHPPPLENNKHHHLRPPLPVPTLASSAPPSSVPIWLPSFSPSIYVQVVTTTSVSHHVSPSHPHAGARDGPCTCAGNAHAHVGARNGGCARAVVRRRHGGGAHVAQRRRGAGAGAGGTGAAAKAAAAAGCGGAWRRAGQSGSVRRQRRAWWLAAAERHATALRCVATGAPDACARPRSCAGCVCPRLCRRSARPGSRHDGAWQRCCGT
mmetsp:Transcript_39973/g.119039  ORF Transcript_39973/g.119039 Transcript_39973/m.119039 type:complete len:271 (+) Transcript_39973:1014-1826(+)